MKRRIKYFKSKKGGQGLPAPLDQIKLPFEVELDGVRYILSFNPGKAQEDRATRRQLIEKTEEKRRMISKNVDSNRWKSEKAIPACFHRWINR